MTIEEFYDKLSLNATDIVMSGTSREIAHLILKTMMTYYGFASKEAEKNNNYLSEDRAANIIQGFNESCVPLISGYINTNSFFTNIKTYRKQKEEALDLFFLY